MLIRFIYILPQVVALSEGRQMNSKLMRAMKVDQDGETAIIGEGIQIGSYGKDEIIRREEYDGSVAADFQRVMMQNSTSSSSSLIQKKTGQRAREDADELDQSNDAKDDAVIGFCRASVLDSGGEQGQSGQSLVEEGEKNEEGEKEKKEEKPKGTQYYHEYAVKTDAKYNPSKLLDGDNGGNDDSNAADDSFNLLSHLNGICSEQLGDGFKVADYVSGGLKGGGNGDEPAFSKEELKHFETALFESSKFGNDTFTTIYHNGNIVEHIEADTEAAANAAGTLIVDIAGKTRREFMSFGGLSKSSFIQIGDGKMHSKTRIHSEANSKSLATAKDDENVEDRSTKFGFIIAENGNLIESQEGKHGPEEYVNMLILADGMGDDNSPFELQKTRIFKTLAGMEKAHAYPIICQKPRVDKCKFSDPVGGYPEEGEKDGEGDKDIDEKSDKDGQICTKDEATGQETCLTEEEMKKRDEGKKKKEEAERKKNPVIRWVDKEMESTHMVIAGVILVSMIAACCFGMPSSTKKNKLEKSSPLGESQNSDHGAAEVPAPVVAPQQPQESSLFGFFFTNTAEEVTGGNALTGEDWAAQQQQKQEAGATGVDKKISTLSVGKQQITDGVNIDKKQSAGE